VKRALVLAGLVCACTKPSAPDAGAAPAPKARGSQDVTSVYAANGAPHPLAERFCRAVHGIRNERRTACCGGALSPSLAERECVRTLSQSLATHAVRIDEHRLGECEAAAKAAFDGCDWPGPNDDQPLADCATLLEGTTEAGASCRSSLECKQGLRCAGGGPTDLGKCDLPGKPPTLCSIAVDPLAAYTSQRTDDTHPECEGSCDHRRCVPALAPGKACVSSLQCGPGRHCAGEAGCLDGGMARQGEACTPGNCANDLRCIGGACTQAHTRGEHCTFDSECIGGCQRDAGMCAPACR
jgi:hypothetical protein